MTLMHCCIIRVFCSQPHEFVLPVGKRSRGTLAT